MYKIQFTFSLLQKNYKTTEGKINRNELRREVKNRVLWLYSAIKAILSQFYIFWLILKVFNLSHLKSLFGVLPDL